MLLRGITSGADIVGRDSELAQMLAVLDVAAGPVGLVLFGAAGIGKSTIWNAGVSAAQDHGHTVLSCRPAETEARLSFGGLVDLLDRVPDETLRELPPPQRLALDVALLRAPADDGPPDHRALCVATLTTIRLLSRSGPVVVAVDDAQWLDEPTAGVLEYAVRRLVDEPVAVLASVRSDDDTAAPLGLAERDNVTTIRLGGLSIGALHRLVRLGTGMSLSRPALNRLRQLSGGNPFYALEVARSLQRSDTTSWPGQPLPPSRTLQELAADSVAALSKRTQTVLLHAAALAHPTVQVVRQALGADQDAMAAIADAEDSRVIELSEGVIRFVHPLLSSAVYASASPSQRRRVHQRLSGLVKDIEQRAWHLALAADGPSADVAAALADAARAAWSRGASNTAAQLWELASTHVTEPAESALLRASAAECVFFAGDAARARELFEAAVADLPACPERASVLLKLALVVYYEDGPNTALALCDRAMADTRGDRLLEARLHLSRSWFCLNDAVLRARHLERARALITGEEAGAWPDLLACVLIANAYFGLLAGFGLSSDDLERGQALLPRQSRTREASMARNVSRVLAKYLDPVRAREEFTETVRHARESGDESAAMQGLVHLGELDCWLGDWERARTRAQEAIEAAEQTGQRPWRPYALYVLALVDAHRGQLDAAHETAELGLRLADEADDSWVAVHQLWVLGFVELSRGDAVAAERRFSAALARCDSARLGDCCIAGLYGDHVEAVVMLGEPDRAMELLDALERRRDLAPRPWMEVVASRARALVRMAQGDMDGAADAMRAAFTALDSLPMPFERARTLLLYGRLLRRRKEKLAARDALLEAKRVFEALGSELWAAQTMAESHRLGLRRGPGHGLTPAELRIAELVVSGLGNREVAAAVFVSVKTVEAHLSRIYRKLGVRGRRELARYELLPAPQGATEQL